MASTYGLRPLKFSSLKFVRRLEYNSKGEPKLIVGVAKTRCLEVWIWTCGLQEMIFILANMIHEESFYTTLKYIY